MASFKVDLEQLEVQLEQWRERLEALGLRAGEISPVNSIDFGQRITALQTQHGVASTTLKALWSADDDQDHNPDSSWDPIESAPFKSN